MAKRKSKKHTNALLGQLEEACKSYGASLVIDEFYFEIKFKDGRCAIYAIPPYEELTLSYMSKARGRVFAKDGKFIGYVPCNSSIEAILVAADMMM